MPHISMPAYIIYCRKSSESEERQVLSIESQIKELKELAARLNLQDSDLLTESRSAKYPGRPVFGLLMQKVSRGEVKGIICWKLDRLARNPIDGAAVVWALDQSKLTEIVTPSNTLRNNSNDKFLMQLEFGMAKKYVDDLSDNVRRGLRMKLEKGWLPGKAPLGYLNDPGERTIVPDPERFPVVRKMWDLLLQGLSPIRIHRIATEELGLRQRTRRQGQGKPTSLSAVYKLFTNPFYYGLIKRKGVLYAGKHEAMITEDEFWKVQEMLGRKGQPRPKIRNFPFTGLIRCGECGCGITAEEKVNRYGSHYVYYHCTRKKRDTPCSQRVIRGEELEHQIVTDLSRIHVARPYLTIVLEHLENEHKKDGEQEAVYQQSREKALQSCLRKLENLNQMRLRDLIGDDEYASEKRKLLDEKLRLTQALQLFTGGGNTCHELASKAFEFAHEAVRAFARGGPDERKAILREIGSNFLLKDRKLSVELKKPFSLIQNALSTIRPGDGGIEPPADAMNPMSIAPSSANFLVLCTLVHDVRTFYEEQLRQEALGPPGGASGTGSSGARSRAA